MRLKYEKILLANGYEKYKEDEKNIEKLISEGSKKKRYTFITGIEAPEEARANKDVFNLRENNYGEFIQIMIISISFTEWIKSLKWVL